MVAITNREGRPAEWTVMQTNIGAAFAWIGARETGGATYERANEAHRGALEVARQIDNAQLALAATTGLALVKKRITGYRESSGA